MTLGTAGVVALVARYPEVAWAVGLAVACGLISAMLWALVYEALR
jgi:hypothetical protein